MLSNSFLFDRSKDFLVFSLSCDPAALWISSSCGVVFSAGKIHTHHLSLFLLTTIVPATISYTVLLCWKKSSVINAGKKNAMEKFLFRARMVDLREERYNDLWLMTGQDLCIQNKFREILRNSRNTVGGGVCANHLPQRCEVQTC